MKNILTAVLVLTAGWATFALLPAQEPAAPGMKTKVGVKGAYGGGVYGGGAPVTGAPYSAVAVTETTQTLFLDGNQIAQTESQKLYRDSQGRERSESGTSADGPVSVVISDPVAKTGYRLNPKDRTAVPAPGALMTSQLAPLTMILRTAINGGEFIYVGAGGSMAPTPAGLTPATETLAPQTIEGVFATGTRNTITIPAGQIGNQKPISVIDEAWYSPDLQMNIMTKHSDPRSGENVFRLTQISRAEPDPQLFQVPADYTMASVAVGVAGGRGGGGRGPAPIPVPQVAVAQAAVPGGPQKIGGNVMMAKLVNKVDPQYTDQARNAKWQGTVTLSVVIDETGKPSDIKVAKPLGLGLDEQAMLAVWQWRFQPTLLNNVPVKVQTNIDVPFRLQ